LDNTIVDEFSARIVAEVADLIYALVVVKLAANVMKYAANPTFYRHKDRLTVIRISVDLLHMLGAHEKGVRAVFDLVLIILPACPHTLPFSCVTAISHACGTRGSVQA
jgi:hypothetical protein